MINKINHLGLIVDGNRRYAKKAGSSGLLVHSNGAEKVEELLDWVLNLTEIKTISLYCLSHENIIKRSKLELHYIKQLLLQYIDKLKSHPIYNNCSVNLMGEIDLLNSSELTASLNGLVEESRNRQPYTLNLLIGYGGRQEIIRAVNILINDNYRNKSIAINEETFRNYLYTGAQSDPDLIIRTGGETRTSNFLLFQSAYSEWYFTRTLWPEFTKEEFLEIIDDYQNRTRRYGE